MLAPKQNLAYRSSRETEKKHFLTGLELLYASLSFQQGDGGLARAGAAGNQQASLGVKNGLACCAELDLQAEFSANGETMSSGKAATVFWIASKIERMVTGSSAADRHSLTKIAA